LFFQGNRPVVRTADRKLRHLAGRTGDFARADANSFRCSKITSHKNTENEHDALARNPTIRSRKEKRPAGRALTNICFDQFNRSVGGSWAGSIAYPMT
jgi:hypothetical protein